MAARDSQQRPRQHAGPAGRRRGHDDAHRRVDFLHRERGRQGVGKDRVGERATRVGEAMGIAADESTDGMEVAHQAAFDGVLHHMQCTAQPGLDFLACPQPGFRFGAEREFAERNPLLFGGVDRLQQHVVHQATRSMMRTVFSAVSA